MSDTAHAPSGMKVMYMVWAWLLGLSLVEVVLAYLHVPLLVMLFCLLGLSILKAAMIVAWFMHMKFERMNLMFTIVPAAILCMLLMNIVWPDSVRARSRALFPDLAPPAPGEMSHGAHGEETHAPAGEEPQEPAETP